MFDSKELRKVTRILERNLESINLTDCCLCNINTAQCHTLVEIGKSPDSKLKDLANTLRIDVSTASKTVEEMVKKELVVREPSRQDRRSVQINLSSQGTKMFNQIEQDMESVFKEIFECIDANKRDTVVESLATFNQAIEQWKAGKSDE